MKHPNIIKIICHDIGRHLGCYGVKSINSNAIDTLAKNGILFKNSFSTSPGCSPSRAAIATGMYPHNTGVLGLVIVGGLFATLIVILQQKNFWSR